MKKIILLIILLFCCIGIHSQDIDKLFLRFDERYYYYDKIERNINASWRFLIPPPHENSFGFVGVSIGIGYGIIQEIFYIGIAGDVALGFDWFGLFSDNNDNNDNVENLQIGVSTGFRLYNLLQIRNFKILSFIGSDFLFAFLPMPYIGLELSFKLIGFEYAHYFPFNYGYSSRHRISIIFRLPND